MKKSIIVLTLFAMGCPSKRIPDRPPTEKMPERLLLNPTNLNKMIAVGANLDIAVFNKDRTPAIVDSAQFNDQNIAVVSQIDGNRVVIEGVSPGFTRLVIQTKDGDAIVEQNLGFSKAVKTHLAHLCQNPYEPQQLAHYVAGTKAVPIWGGLLDDKRKLIGYGFAPFELSGDAQFNENSEDQIYLRIDMGMQSGEVSLTSTIDDKKIILSIIDEEDFNGIELDNEITSPSVSIGKKTLAKFHPTVDGVRVCSVESTFEFKTTTPEICDVQIGTPLRRAWMEGKTGLLSIEGKAAGDCEITVSYPDGMSGAQQFDIAIKVTDDA